MVGYDDFAVEMIRGRRRSFIVTIRENDANGVPQKVNLTGRELRGYFRRSARDPDPPVVSMTESDGITILDQGQPATLGQVKVQFEPDDTTPLPPVVCVLFGHVDLLAQGGTEPPQTVVAGVVVVSPDMD